MRYNFKLAVMNKIKILIAVLFSMYAFNGICQNTYTIRNNNIEFSVDGKGNLLILKNTQTGQNYASGKPMWRLYFDRTDEKDIEVLASENQPVINQSDDHITVTYNDIKSRGKNVNFGLTLKIVLEKDELRFSSEITNNEMHTIVRELQYPLIGNCVVPPDHKLLTTMRGGHVYGKPVDDILAVPHSYMGPDQKFRQMDIKYPIGVSANCFALIGENQGLYFGSHDATFQTTGHGLRVYPDENGDFDQFEAGLYKYPNCMAGETWCNDANVVVPYSGDWHRTSSIYRAWANIWWEHREEPLWVKRMLGFQRVILKHQYGETLFPYTDFATRIKDAGESVGINVAFPFGWWSTGMDNGYPDCYYKTDASQGGDPAWKKAVSDYKKDGGKVLMYFNGKLIDTESEYYRNGDGKEVCLKNNSGIPFFEDYRFSGPGTFTGYYNERSFVVADPKNEKWRQKLVDMADRAIELGANSVFYDQLGYAEKICNWDVSKEFPVPDLCIIAGKAGALKKIHDYIDTKDKDFAIGTEHITDVTSQYVDYVHGLYNLGSWTIKGNTNFIDWFRYTFPEVILAERDIDGVELNIEWLVNRSFLLGLRTNLQTFRLRGLVTDLPHHQQYLATANQLRMKYCSLLLEGTYRDTEGFKTDNKSVEARSYVKGNQMAIVMTHMSNDPAISQLVVSGYQYLESSWIGDATVDAGNKDGQKVMLGKNGLVVLVYERKK